MAAPSPPLLDPARIHRISQQVLSRPEFERPGRSLVQRVEDAIVRAVTRALASALSGHGSLLGSLVILGVVLVILGLIVRFARTVRRQPSVPLGLVTGPARPATDWDADALGHQRDGRWRDVVRCRYRAAVAALAAHGMVEEADGRTTGEYRRALDQRLPEAGPAFGQLTDLFERTWYGDAPAGEAEATTAARLRLEVEAVASRPPGRPVRTRKPEPAGRLADRASGSEE